MNKGKILMSVMLGVFILSILSVSAEPYVPALFNIGSCPSAYNWNGRPEAVGNTGQVSIIDYNGDSGYGRILVNFCSINDYALLIISDDQCGNKETTCPEGYSPQGRIRSGHECDGDMVGKDYRGVELDAGWFTLCSKDNSVIFSEREDDCDTHSTWFCPDGYDVKGKIHMGSGALCNKESGVDYLGRTMKAGWMNLCVKKVQDPVCQDNYCVEEQFCSINDVYTRRICHNFTLENHECKENIETTEELVKECVAGCEDGECKEYECTQNYECTDTECDNLDGCVGDDYYDYSDINNDCVNFMCESNSCSAPDISYNDVRCIQPECTKNSDCAVEFISDPFCQNNDVYHNVPNFACVDYKCLEPRVISQLTQDCGEDSSGSWENFCNYDDLYRKRNVKDRGCLGGLCFENEDIEEEFIVSCEFGCKDGECNPVPGNHNPEITSIPVEIGVEDTTYTYDVNAIDVDGDNLTYILTENPSGMVIDSSTGFILWNYPVVGDYDIAIRVEDGKGGFDTQSYVLKINEGELECEIDLDCQDDYCGDWNNKFCYEDNVYRERKCHDFSCINNSCADSSSVEKDLVEECEFGCEDGKCIEEDDDEECETCGRRGSISISFEECGNLVCEFGEDKLTCPEDCKTEEIKLRRGTTGEVESEVLETKKEFNWMLWLLIGSFILLVLIIIIALVKTR